MCELLGVLLLLHRLLNTFISFIKESSKLIGLSFTDVELSCDFMKSCMLLCSFVPGEEVVIHWIQLKENLNVHSYYHGQDQLAYQNPRFKGRTSLFQDQVSAGNASLLLYDVQIQDETKYKCYISTISGSKDSYINLKVAGRR